MVINGTKIDGMAKQVTTTVNGKEVLLNMCYITEIEATQGTTFEFSPVRGNDEYIAKACKAGNKIGISLIKKGKGKEKEQIVFSDLSAQALFTVVESAFGQSKTITNGIYVRANPARKQSARAESKIVVNVEGGVL